MNGIGIGVVWGCHAFGDDDGGADWFCGERHCTAAVEHVHAVGADGVDAGAVCGAAVGGAGVPRAA